MFIARRHMLISGMILEQLFAIIYNQVIVTKIYVSKDDVNITGLMENSVKKR